MKSEDARKLILAVQDKALGEKLKGLLQGEEVEVVYNPRLSSADPTDIEADVVVLRSENLDRESLPAILRSGQQDDSPGVVVLGDEDGAAEVELVAAGASAVLEPQDSHDALAEQLVELAEAEAEGGLDGPEAAGSVAEPKLADFQSRSAIMRDFLSMVRRVAATDSTLLITGETGVGKERLARAIHAESSRSGGPFVTVNCGALPEQLLESELFGHTRGAFTGASSARKGHFEAADGGTLFLDEVGEMPTQLQVKLLTVLQRREVQPLGASSPKPVNVRILAATNRDLARDVHEGRFREDLFFRLNVVSLVIPALRERPEDLPGLVGRFLRHFIEVHQKPQIQGIAPGAMRLLQTYAWPGNIRELVNAVERAVLFCERDLVTPEDLPDSLLSGSDTDQAQSSRELYALPLQEAKRQTVAAFEKEYLRYHLKQHHGLLADVARDAGINPRTLYEKMKRFGLKKEMFQ